MCYFISCKQVVHLSWDYAQAQSKAHVWLLCHFQMPTYTQTGFTLACFLCEALLATTSSKFRNVTTFGLISPKEICITWQRCHSTGKSSLLTVEHPHTPKRLSLLCWRWWNCKKETQFLLSYLFLFFFYLLFVCPHKTFKMGLPLVEGLQHWHKA